MDKKKKKLVSLEWPKLRAIRDSLDRDRLGIYKGMKGVVMFGHQRLLDGEKLELILRIAPWLDLDKDMESDWPRRKNFNAGEGLVDLIAALDHVLQVSRAKDKSSELGFVALYSDTEGTYWFRCSRGFHTALNESISSLESLADALGESSQTAERERVSALYRKLSGFFE